METHECMYRCVQDERMDGSVGGWMNACTGSKEEDDRMYKRKASLINRWVGRQMNTWNGGWTDV